jgi:hypothetical protein
MTARDLPEKWLSNAKVCEQDGSWEAAAAWQKCAHDLRAALAGAGAVACDWTLDDGPWHTIWESACGQSWSFVDGGPEDNRVSFCHGCGKPVNPIRPDTAALEADR